MAFYSWKKFSMDFVNELLKDGNDTKVARSRIYLLFTILGLLRIYSARLFWSQTYSKGSEESNPLD